MEIIAEIGQNHNGDIKLACEMIAAVAEAGADVAKFQVYETKALFAKEGNPWYEYNCKTELTRDNIQELIDICAKHKIEFMASVFDTTRVQWLEEMGGSLRYKIASRSIKEASLIQALVDTGKPIIASLGMWEGDAFPHIPSKTPVDFLYCISKYPTELEDLHFSKIDFQKYAGFSDHTIGITAPMAALARGARIIEKHFTLDKEMYGPDHEGSMTPDELKGLSTFRDELKRAL